MSLAPLPASSRLLADGRFEVNISRPSAKREGSWIAYQTARFPLTAKLDAIVSWAADNTPAGHHFNVTAYRAKDGFQAHAVTLP
jgi:hypothetical protein